MTGHVPERGDPVATTIATYDRNPDRWAGTWDALTPTGEQDLVAQLAARLDTDATVVDLGCGSGRDLIRLADAGLHPVGVELSTGLAAIAAERGPVEQADLRDLPFDDATFDGALASASLLHLPPQDLVAALIEIRRVVRRGGHVALSMKRATPGGPVTGIDGHGRHVTYVGPAGLDHLLDAADLQVIWADPVDDSARPGLRWEYRIAVRR